MINRTRTTTGCCIGDRFKIANEVSFCAEPYSPGSWYLAAKKASTWARAADWARILRLFDYHATNGC